MTLSVVVKAAAKSKAIVRNLGFSFSFVKYGAEAGWVNTRKLCGLLQEYFAFENGKDWALYENITVRCSVSGAAAEISFKNWPDSFRLAAETEKLQLVEAAAPAEADDPRLKIPKKHLNFDVAHAIHDPDAKGFCRHCFRKINKHTMNAHCEQRRRDMLDEAMPAEKKKRIEQEAEQYSLSGFRR